MTRFRGPLVGFLAGLGNDRQRAVELAQDTFAEAYLSRDRFVGSWDEVSAVGGWLRGIAHNVHLSRWRRDRGPRAFSTMDAADRVAVHDAPPREATPSPVGKALARLRAPWRTVLEMRYLDGSGLPEIAAVLGLSVRAVEGRLRRARHELKASLPDCGHELAEEKTP
ncbi:MAG: RNA polymerase sigma factor [Planctomycetes bacterium]|nr:RNA polymerase sigma factor [Planctomycetota bacterium]